MILRPCPFCNKDIPRAITVCPYCHRDEQGKPVIIDTAVEQFALSDREFEALLKELSSEDAYTREQAVTRAAQYGRGIVQSFMTVLNDFSKPNLGGVARALGKIGDERAVSVLAQAAKVGDEDLRMAAVRSLAQINRPEVIPFLLIEAERPHPTIQSYVAFILGSFHDSRVIPVLSRLAVHPNQEVAFQAACALGETGGQSSIQALRNAWRKNKGIVRTASLASLRKLGARPTRFSKTVTISSLLGMGATVGGLLYYFYK